MTDGGTMLDARHLGYLGDIGATLLAGLSIASQCAQLLTPIATLILTSMGIIWWCIRFRAWLTEGKIDE